MLQLVQATLSALWQRVKTASYLLNKLYLLYDDDNSNNEMGDDSQSRWD